MIARTATVICLAIAAGGVLATLAAFFLGAERLQAPDLETWTHGEPAWDSTPLLGRIRGKKDGRRPLPGVRPVPGDPVPPANKCRFTI